MNPHPQTVEDVIMDFKGRRSAIIKALTKNVDQFYQLCNPNRHSLSLYGFPDQQWQVNPPFPNWDLPDPKSGINLVRDSMNKHQWLSMVALHSDAWLHSVASYFAVKLKLDNSDRKRLFNKIADVCSVLEAINGEPRKRKRKDIDGILAEELLVEILSRVPVRDVVRYRSVCKRWRSLIDDPGFACTHLSNYKCNSEGTHLLVIELHIKEHMYEQVLVRRSDTFRKVMGLNNCLNYGEWYYQCDNLNYISGVMLIRKQKFNALNDIILWNPSINTSLSISNWVFQDLREAKFFELGLGFDASSNDLKVVAIVYPHAELTYCYDPRYRGAVPGHVYVYALSSKSWGSKVGVHPPPYWTSGRQVFVNGGIHWMNLGPEIRHGASWAKMKDSHIVAFDVSNEVFNYFELPSEVVEDHDGKRILNKFPIVLEGSLGMICRYGFHNDVWVMEEYGVPNSWSKLYKLEIQIDNLLHFKSNGELLFSLYGKGIKSYDAKRNSVKHLRKTHSRFPQYRIYTYVESLLLGCKWA